MAYPRHITSLMFRGSWGRQAARWVSSVWQAPWREVGSHSGAQQSENSMKAGMQCMVDPDLCEQEQTSHFPAVSLSKGLAKVWKTVLCCWEQISAWDPKLDKLGRELHQGRASLKPWKCVSPLFPFTPICISQNRSWTLVSFDETGTWVSAAVSEVVIASLGEAKKWDTKGLPRSSSWSHLVI